MAKNNQLISFYKTLNARTSDILPKMYSAVAIALWECLDMSDDDKVEAIESIILDTQYIWQQCADGHIDILERCKELTGIDVQNEC